MILRTIKCDVCGAVETEKTAGSGWNGWGSLQGVSLNGVDNPSLCKEHLAKVAEFIDTMAGAK